MIMCENTPMLDRTEINKGEVFDFFREEANRLFELTRDKKDENREYPLAGIKSRGACRSMEIKSKLYKDDILSIIFKTEDEKIKIGIMSCYIDDELAECESILSTSEGSEESEDLKELKERITILKRIKNKIQEILIRL